MRMRGTLAMVGLSAMVLAGCSGGAGRSGEDPRYASLMETAGSIFALGNIKQARQQYASALDRAFLANDPQAIHDAGFNLATSELRLKDYQACLATVQKIAQALTVRGWPDARQTDLHLVRAAALYEQGQWRASGSEAAMVTGDSETRNEAYGLAGLDAAELADRPGLDQAIARLAPSREMRDQANLRELLVQRDLMDRHWSSAATEADTLARSREDAGDYEAMRRALRLEARAFQAMGQSDAATRLRQQAADSQKVNPLR